MKKRSAKPRKAVASAADAPGSRQGAKLRIKPFDIGGTDKAALNPPLTTAKSKAEEWEARSKWEAEDGLADWSEISLANAREWQTLTDIPEVELERRDSDCWSDLTEGVDFLLARAQKSKLAAAYLSRLIDHAISGLRALAAHGDNFAATLLIDQLIRATTQFEFLAWHRPELFTHYTSRLAAIPATISRKKENAEECAQLMEKLLVGKKSVFSITASGKQWRESTPINGLAVRLVGYIDNNRWLSKLHAGHLHIYDDCPTWFPSLANLDVFGKATWKAWAEAAWGILLDVTSEKPQEHQYLRPIGKSAAKKKPKYCKNHGEATKASNVKHKIRERLLKAFKAIAGDSDSSPSM